MTSHKLSIGRRAVIGAIPALALLAGCAKKPGTADAAWMQSGSAADTIDHSAWDALLARHVKPAVDGVNRVDYAAFKQNDGEALKKYLAALQAADVTKYPKDEQFAFWVNLYNAATVDVILKNYPLTSIREIGLLGPWGDKTLTVGGKPLSLDDIEHNILRPVWKDVRIHYAVNCASIGCPNLATKAYTADRLEAMLDEAARAFINHPRGFTRIDGALVASSIFSWYGDDWGGPAKLLDHARAYASEATKVILGNASNFDRHDYDWSLNDIA